MATTVNPVRAASRALAHGVELRQGKRRIAGPAKVKNGVAALSVRFPKAGKLKLTAIFAPAGGGAKVTQPVTVTVGR